MSRTIKFAKAGGPEVLEFIEMEVPAPGPREVRIKVMAIGINRADSMWRNDKYVESPILPAGLGYNCAGMRPSSGSTMTSGTARLVVRKCAPRPSSTPVRAASTTSN